MWKYLEHIKARLTVYWGGGWRRHGDMRDCGLGTLNYEQVSVIKLGQFRVDGQLL